MSVTIPSAEEVKETVKESLLGVETPEGVSTESRNRFLQYASIEENGELFMSREDFINAIAPPDEDYVSISIHALSLRNALYKQRL